MSKVNNPYLPQLATVTTIIEETPTIKSFQVILNDAEKMKHFSFHPGQVGQLSIFGVGEATFVINSPPTRMDYLQFSVMKAGEITSALHELTEGDQVGVRAPLGNWFPYEAMKGKRILFIGGGIGLAPLRTLILFMLDNRDEYDDITIIYGARTPPDLCYKDELQEFCHSDRKGTPFINTRRLDPISRLWHSGIADLLVGGGGEDRRRNDGMV